MALLDDWEAYARQNFRRTKRFQKERFGEQKRIKPETQNPVELGAGIPDFSGRLQELPWCLSIRTPLPPEPLLKSSTESEGGSCARHFHPTLNEIFLIRS